MKGVQEKAEVQINNLIDNKVIEVIEGKTLEAFNQFMEREITITNEYGNTVKQYPNVNNLIEEKWDKFITLTVDSSTGKPVGRNDYVNGQRMKRIEYMIDHQLKQMSDKFTTETVKRVSEEIKKYVESGLTNKLGSELMSLLKVDKMLQGKS
jgi:hypothetical protein